TLRLLIRRRQATTSTLCTSRPAHRLCNVFIATSLGRGRREALAHRILPTVFQDLHSQLGQPHPLTTITGARRASGQTHSRARSHQATPTSLPTAPHPNPFHPSGCARAHANSFVHRGTSHEIEACRGAVSLTGDGHDGGTHASDFGQPRDY